MLQYSENDRISWDQIFEHEIYNKSPEEFLGLDTFNQINTNKRIGGSKLMTLNFDDCPVIQY